MKSKVTPLKKTCKCNWCNKYKNSEQGYKLGILDDKKWFICNECNLKHDVI